MKSSTMALIELTISDFRRNFERLSHENPGATVRVIDNGVLVTEMILPLGPKPKGWPEGAKLIGDGVSIVDFVSEQRD